MRVEMGCPPPNPSYNCLRHLSGSGKDQGCAWRGRGRGRSWPARSLDPGRPLSVHARPSSLARGHPAGRSDLCSSPDGADSQADSPASESDLPRVGHAWDATQCYAVTRYERLAPPIVSTVGACPSVRQRHHRERAFWRSRCRGPKIGRPSQRSVTAPECYGQSETRRRRGYPTGTPSDHSWDGLPALSVPREIRRDQRGPQSFTATHRGAGRQQASFKRGARRRSPEQ